MNEYPMPLGRRRFLKGAAGIGAGLAAGSWLSSCGSDSTASSSSSTPIGSSGTTGTTAGSTAQTSGSGATKLWIMFDEATTNLTAEEIAQFEGENNVKLTIELFDLLKYNAAVAAGAPPDLARTQGASEMPNLVARGLVENLDPYFAKSTLMKPDDFAAITGVYRFDGTKSDAGPIFGFPIDYSQDGMLWLNTEHFDGINEPIPSADTALSYDELLEIGKRLTKRDGDTITQYGLDLSWGFVEQGKIAQLAAQQGSQLWSDDLTSVDFQQPEVRKAFQYFVDWAQARVGGSPLDPLPDWNGPTYNARRMSIIAYGYWFRGWINGVSSGDDTGDLIDKSAFRPAPQMGSNRIDACWSGTGMFIPSKAANKDLAFKFLEFMFGGSPATRHFEGGAGLPGLKSQEALLPQETPVDQAQFDVQTKNLKYFVPLRFSPYVDGAAMQAAITSAIEPVMRGENDLEPALEQLQREAESIIASGKELLGG